MLGWLLGAKNRKTARALPRDLPALSREDIRHFITPVEGLPQLDWGMALAWIDRQTSREPDGANALCRAVAAPWLDELRDALTTDSRRWRHWSVEGLAPVDNNLSQRVAKWTDHAFGVVGPALRDVRGDPKINPIPPIGIIVLGTADEYYSFISHFYDEGEFATSAGVYLHATVENGFPLIALNAETTHELDRSIAHELTHHALKPEHPALSAGLPLWVEEGFTQMMEEHVTRQSHFVFGRDMLERHRELWEEIGFDGFVSGETFHSPEGEQQELSYNLAEAMTRWLATTQRRNFFAFVRACRNDGHDPDTACREHLGGAVGELAESLVWTQSR